MEERVERLEKSMRRWRFISLGLVVGLSLFSGLFAWREFGTRGSIKARTIHIVGQGDAKLVELSSNTQGGVIRTSNLEGSSLFLTASDPKGRGTVATFNGKGSELVYVAATDSGGALVVMNSMGTEVVNLQSSKANCGLMIARDYEGNTRETLSGSRGIASGPHTQHY